MPVILLEIDAKDASGTALGAVKAQLGQLDGIMTQASATAGKLSLAITDVGMRSTSAIAGVSRLAKSLGAVNDELTTTAGACDRYLQAIGRLDGAARTGISSQDGMVTGLRGVIVALGDTGIAIDAYIGRLGAMDAAQLAAAGSARNLGLASSFMPGVGGANSVAGAAVSRASIGSTASTDAALLSGRGVAGAAVGQGSILSAFTGAAFSPAGIAAIVAGYIGYSAISEANAFQSAIAQVATQAGAPLGGVQASAQTALGYAGSGKSMYSPTQQVEGQQLLYSLGLSADAIKASVIPLAQVSAQNAAPDEITAGKAIVAMVGSGGYGAGTSAQQMQGYFDLLSRTEQEAATTPGAVTRALPTLLSATKGTGVSMTEAMQYLVQETRGAGFSPQKGSTYFSQLMTHLVQHPNAAGDALANAAGISLSPQGVRAAGGLDPFLQQIHDAFGGNIRNERTVLGTVQAQRGFDAQFDRAGNIVSGDLAQTAPDNAARAASTLNLGINEQMTETANRFHADITKFGLNLQDPVMTTLIQSANLFLAAGELSFHTADQLGNKKDAVTAGLQGLGNFFAGGGSSVAGAIQSVVNATGNTLGSAKGFVGRQLSQEGFILGSAYSSNPSVPQAAVPSPTPVQFTIGGQNAALGFNPLSSSLTADLAAAGTSSASAVTARAAGSRLPAMPDVTDYRADFNRQASTTLNSVLTDIGNKNAAATTLTASMTALNALIKQNAPNAALNAQLGVIRMDLTNQALPFELKGGRSAVTQAGDASTRVVTAIENTRALTASSNQLAAASVFAQSVQVHHGTVQQEEHAAQLLYQASLSYAKLEFAQGKISKIGYTDAQNQALNAYQGSMNQGAAQGLSALQDKLTLATLQKNPAAEQAASAAMVAYEKANAQALGLSSTQLASNAIQVANTAALDRLNPQIKNLENLAQIAKLQGNTSAYGKYETQKTNLEAGNATVLGLQPSDIALLNAQLQVDIMGAFPRINTRPFFQSNAGLAGFQAGPESTSVRLGGAGEDPLVVENRQLRNENTRDNAEIIRLLGILAANRINPNIASLPPPGRG